MMNPAKAFEHAAGQKQQCFGKKNTVTIRQTVHTEFKVETRAPARVYRIGIPILMRQAKTKIHRRLNYDNKKSKSQHKLLHFKQRH